jgi:hypothetical protein
MSEAKKMKQHLRVPYKAVVITVCAIGLILLPSFWTELRAESVRLAWNPSSEAGVAGHNVYRSGTPGGPYTRVNKSLIQSSFYTDNSAEINGTYYYSVTTVHAAGVESRYSSELKVVVGFPETALVAKAGPDLAVNSGRTVILSGSAWDPEGRPLVYSWSQISGTTVTIIRADKSEATFLAPVVSQDNYLLFRLTVTNGEGGSATDSVRVTVRR